MWRAQKHYHAVIKFENAQKIFFSKNNMMHDAVEYDDDTDVNEQKI